MSELKVSEANLSVYIHPSKTKDVSDAVTRELSSLLFKFNENFDGVLLAYEVVGNVSKKAKILSGLYPYVSVSLKANLLLFSPKKGMFVEGKVVKVSRESVHVVVLGFAAAVISEENIREEFKFRTKHSRREFRSRLNKRHIIRVGTMIRFFVESFDEEVLHMSGSLKPANTGSLRWLDNSSDEIFKSDRKDKKRYGSDVRAEAEGVVLDGGASSVNNEHSKKKSKRHRVD